LKKEFNGRVVQEAYMFQRSQRGAPARLLEFYRRAEELDRLDAVLQLSLSRPEEEEEFLK
jgi:hypothetical protein